MTIDILTKEDFLAFKEEIMQFLNVMQKKEAPSTKNERWLRSYEVKKLLKISTGTLQTLRVNSVLNPKKIGGIHLYDYEEICKVLEKPKQLPR